MHEQRGEYSLCPPKLLLHKWPRGGVFYEKVMPNIDTQSVPLCASDDSPFHS